MAASFPEPRSAFGTLASQAYTSIVRGTHATLEKHNDIVLLRPLPALQLASTVTNMFSTAPYVHIFIPQSTTHTRFLGSQPPHMFKCQANTCFSTSLPLRAIVLSLHLLAVSHLSIVLSSAMRIPLCAWCGGLQVFSCTFYCSGDGLCLGTLPTTSKEEEEEEKPHPSLSPQRVLCKFLLCCASFTPC